MHLRKTLVLALFLAGVVSVSAKAPAAPSNLRVKPLGVNSFLLEWNDNAKDEKGWEIRAIRGKTARPVRYQLVPYPDITSYVVITNELPGETLSFQLAAYNGTSGAETLSKPSSIVTTRALLKSSFNPPTNASALTLDDGRIRLGWKDLATTEHGYKIEYKTGSGKWKVLGTTNPGVSFSFPASGFEPATRYSFRVRAFKGNPASHTAYSNIVTTTTMPFQAPDTLVAKPEGEGAITFSWKDRSAVEGGFELQWRSGTGDFTSLGEVGANFTSTTPIKGFSLDTEYQFRIRALRTVNSSKVYTGFSNVASAKTVQLSNPTNLAGQPISESSVRLTWDDPSVMENGFEIQALEAGTTDYKVLDTVAANIKEYTATGLSPGKVYDFRVRAYDLFAYSAFSPAVQVTTRDGITGDLDPAVFWNTSFIYPVGVSRPAQLASLEVEGLPSGLVYQSSSRTISGTTVEEGVKTVTLKATFNDGYVVTRSLVLRVIRPPAAPVVGAAFAPVEVLAGSSTPVSMTGKFSDPDATDARRVTTTLGSFDIVLYPLATPGTVANFLSYANAGRYDGSFFHRSPDGFVVQGGGYIHDGSVFSEVPKAPSIQNEPGISNTAGTVAMAKVGGFPDSATSEFFVSVNNNAANLDDQNGGFTVFGRVAGAGMSVVNAINALPRSNYTVTVGGSSRRMEDVPMDVVAPAPDVMDPTKLVKVTSVTAVPSLRYEVSTGNPAVATATVNGSTVDITGVAAGNTTVQVKAIDLDGEMVSQTIPVTVP